MLQNTNMRNYKHPNNQQPKQVVENMNTKTKTPVVNSQEDSVKKTTNSFNPINFFQKPQVVEIETKSSSIEPVPKIEPIDIQKVEKVEIKTRSQENIETSENIAKKTNANFNFIAATPNNNTITSFAEAKKTEIKSKMLNSKFSQNNNALIVMFIVIVCLIGLCAFTTLQIYKYEQEIIKLKNTGQNTSKIKDKTATWSGKNIEIDIFGEIPDGFIKEEKESNFEFLDNKNGNITSFLAIDDLAGDIFTNGIIIYSSPFDSKIGQTEFTQKVLQKVGNSYSLTDQKIQLPNDFTATKIVSKDKNNVLNYYCVVSNKNYYVIKTYQQGKESIKTSKKIDFVNAIVPNIKLN